VTKLHFYLNLSVHPESRVEADRILTALSEGAEIEMPIATQAWGDYYGALKDRFGVQWMVNYSPRGRSEPRAASRTTRAIDLMESPSWPS
jgi:uncharacterized glyoxalase superfamily protein PhnB